MIRLLCYTRLPISEAEYAPRLGLSMHLAYETDDGFKPLNHNTGVLFAKATQNPETLLLTPKSIKEPRVCALPNGGFFITAIRVEANGEPDESSKGCVALFKSDDLLHYTEIGLVKICDDYIETIETKICKNCGLPTVKAKAGEKTYRARLDAETLSLVKVEEGGCIHKEEITANIEGCVPGNVFAVSDELCIYLTKKLLTPVNTEILLDKNITVSSLEDLNAIRATAVYSDGSTAQKRIDWDLDSIDLSTPGEYKVTGNIHQDHFPFPIAINRADPVIYRHEGNYYFIATNDADWNHTLYMRKAKSIPELVNAEEHLVLDTETYDHVKGLLWAPEFHVVGGKLYLFHACTTGEFGDEQSHVTPYNGTGDLIEKSSWDMPVKVLKADGSPLYTKGITLDMTTFDINGETYAAWSQRQFTPCDLGAWVYIAKLNQNEPWKLLTDPVLLTIPEYGWQNNHTLVDEGPFALVRGGKIYLTFSSALVDSTYCVGMLTANIGDDLLNPNSWVKTNYPLLHSQCVKGEYGVGHNAYIEDEYGDIWNTYHGRPGIDAPRSSGIRRVHFGFDGEPVLDLTEELDVNPALKAVEVTVTVK